MAKNTNAALPKISYVKGIDIFLLFSFVMTFFSVIEYGLVTHVHREIERKKKRIKRKKTTANETNTQNNSLKKRKIL